MRYRTESRDFHAAQSYEFDYDAVDGLSPDDSIARMHEFVKRLLSFLRTSPRKSLTLDCLYVAMGDAPMDMISLTDIAKKHGVTKQSVSIRVKELQRKLYLGPIRSQKSPVAGKSYELSNWRPKLPG